MTRYTDKSRYSLVATAARDGRRLVAVVLGAESKDIRAETATSLLDRGFGAKTVMKQSPVPNPKSSTQATGRAGVQFGAFGTKTAAAAQAKRVKAILGCGAEVSQGANGVWRVRVNGVSEQAAKKLKNDAGAHSIDCYIFH